MRCTVHGIPSPDRLRNAMDPTLTHSLQADQLPAWLRQRFVELQPDDALLGFIDGARRRPHGALKTWLHRCLRHVTADFDVNAYLRMYRLHLLSTPQWQLLLGPVTKRRESLLDVGAGSGDLTAALAALFPRIHTTEVSRPMARRLRRRGFTCDWRDVSETGIDGSYDAVSCLNVLDRCKRPRTLLRTLAGAVAPGGALILATPLPFDPFYFDGPRTLEPAERLDAPGPGWESALNQLVNEVGSQLPNWRLTRFSRAPYLSWGDSRRPYYVHDDAVLIWRRVNESAS